MTDLGNGVLFREASECGSTQHPRRHFLGFHRVRVKAIFMKINKGSGARVVSGRLSFSLKEK